MAAALSRSLPHALTHPDNPPQRRVVGAVGPVGRARAVALLAAGHTDSAVAHALTVDRGTVRRWRAEPDVAAALARARREREAASAEALDDARRILAEAAPRAAQALVDALEGEALPPAMPGASAPGVQRGRRGVVCDKTLEL